MPNADRCRHLLEKSDPPTRKFNGGHRIRSCKGLRPPVFKTGALAIQPALPAVLTYRHGRAYHSESYDVSGGPCGLLRFRYTFGPPSSNKNRTGECRFSTFSFDVLAEDRGTSVVQV